VSINVCTKLDFDKEDIEVLTLNGATRLLTFRTKQTTPLEFDKGAHLVGTYIAPNATVRMKWDQIDFKGAICAERIDIHKDCRFVDHASTYTFPKVFAGSGNAAEIGFGLEQNYPNPFNPSTSIVFSVPEAGPVRLAIYDALGREVKTLVDQAQNSGTYIVQWDGTDAGSVPVASGTYMYRLTAGGQTQFRQMTLSK
jgi:hypothetical protein